MRVGQLGFMRNRGDCGGMEVDEGENSGGYGAGEGQGKEPTKLPGLGGRLGGGQHRWLRLWERKSDYRAALGADGEMAEQQFALVRGQGMLNEGADLVRVWMELELERLAHVVPVAALGAA